MDKATGKSALIIVDVQNDFCEGGALGVEGGTKVAGLVAEHVAQHRLDYDHVVATADWHEDPGAHFSQTPDFVDSWPPHCRVGTDGARFHPDVEPAISEAEAIFRKGLYAAAYSGFEGEAEARDGESVGLADWLRARDVERVDVVGIATDHCVKATALDAVKEGFATRVLLGLTAGVSPVTIANAIDAMGMAGVELEGAPVG